MATQTAIPRQVMLQARVIWAAMLIGQVVFGVVVYVMSQQAPRRAAVNAQVLLYAAIAIVATMMPVVVVLRARLLKDGEAISPAAYVKANILSLAICEGQTFALLVMCMVSGQMMPMLALAAVPGLAFVAMFPRNPGWKS